eukprot:NODE_3529_length_773_cov_315.540390.p2 GENE.NODE_3529_length_773_cov_315.540390~~NODE_3529_length_773_cov_315.540390.p2  ORF type:complete len:156 (-),score=47.48 NODE_3529_length_773_cov_315.540390:274-741(-)
MASSWAPLRAARFLAAPSRFRGALPAESRRGYKYTLFPRLDFLAYLRSIHVSYHPRREHTEVARRLIMRMTSDAIKKRHPRLKATWEHLDYEAPAAITVVLLDGRRKRFLAEHYSRREMNAIVEEWQLHENLQHMPAHDLEPPPEQQPPPPPAES